jgi:SAM-dependent methyltransferase
MFGKQEAVRLRKAIFSRSYTFDSELAHCLDDHTEFMFLKNPVVQNIYTYQIEYVRAFSKKWFNDTGISLLDWGCGKGHVSYWLKTMGENITSCDVTDTGVTSAFNIKSPLFKRANIDVVALNHDYILPFEDSSFDVVLSFGVLEHVPNDIESLQEIRRVLKQNGLFFCFYLPYKWSYTQNIQHLRGRWYHDKLYEKKMVKGLLMRSQFQLLDIWHRALLPKISFVPPLYHTVERIDNWFCNYTLLKYFATNIEFVSCKA